MKKMIYCNFLNRQAESQDYQIYPGKLGKILYNTISKEAWIIWQREQTKLINEKKLNMMNPVDRKIIEKEMIKFLLKENHFNNDKVRE